MLGSDRRLQSDHRMKPPATAKLDFVCSTVGQKEYVISRNGTCTVDWLLSGNSLQYAPVWWKASQGSR